MVSVSKSMRSKMSATRGDTPDVLTRAAFTLCVVTSTKLLNALMSAAST